jgi:hypothetical protein
MYLLWYPTYYLPHPTYDSFPDPFRLGKTGMCILQPIYWIIDPDPALILVLLRKHLLDRSLILIRIR